MTSNPRHPRANLTEAQAAQAVERFIDAWNARDPGAFAEAALSTDQILRFLRQTNSSTTRSQPQ